MYNCELKLLRFFHHHKKFIAADQMSMKRGKKQVPFSEAMDRKLMKLVDVYGTNNWNMIARNFKDQSAKKCKERWRIYLSPKNGELPWSQEEDEMLMMLESQIGTKWTSISQKLTRRTAGDVRNRYLKIKRRESKQHNKKAVSENKTVEMVLPLHSVKPKVVHKQENIVKIENTITPEEENSKYIIEKIFGPHREEFLLEFSGIFSFKESLI